MRTIFDAGAYIADDGYRLILLDPNPVVHRLIQICGALAPTTVEVKRRSDIANVPGQARPPARMVSRLAIGRRWE
jgi:hypothetical protein